jgi:hypothetical protein
MGGLGQYRAKDPISTFTRRLSGQTARNASSGKTFQPERRLSNAPPQCSGSGVTAGSTPGASACTIAPCGNTCDTNADTFPATNNVFDDSPNSVYNPIGTIYGDAGARSWNPMNEHFIKDELVQHGPVTAGFTVTDGFSFFNQDPTGVFTGAGPQRKHGGHAVSIVGWGKKGTQKYWLVRNSWGRDWGDSGFFRIAIGGDAAVDRTDGATIGFGTDGEGIAAMSPLLKTGSYRRLEDETDKLRRLAEVTVNPAQVSVSKHGGHEACTADHQTEIDALRTWFLANKANYNGVSSGCAVPWAFDSMDACTVQIIKGFHLKTIFHVTDCDQKKYHMSVRLAYDHTMKIASAMVIANGGPSPVDLHDESVHLKSQLSRVATTSGAIAQASVGTVLAFLAYMYSPL